MIRREDSKDWTTKRIRGLDVFFNLGGEAFRLKRARESRVDAIVVSKYSGVEDLQLRRLSRREMREYLDPKN